MLAYYFYPFEPNHNISEYTEEDLRDPVTIEQLFDYCQILEGYITKSGWQYLIDTYSYERLYEIDKRSGWLSGRSDNDTLEEYIQWVKYEMSISEEN